MGIYTSSLNKQPSFLPIDDMQHLTGPARYLASDFVRLLARIKGDTGSNGRLVVTEYCGHLLEK